MRKARRFTISDSERRRRRRVTQRQTFFTAPYALRKPNANLSNYALKRYLLDKSTNIALIALQPLRQEQCDVAQWHAHLAPLFYDDFDCRPVRVRALRVKLRALIGDDCAYALSAVGNGGKRTVTLDDASALRQRGAYVAVVISDVVCDGRHVMFL